MRDSSYLPTPNWDKWAQMTIANLLDAVALSWDVAPERMWHQGILLRVNHPGLTARYQIAVDAIKNDDLDAFQIEGPHGQEFYGVKLKDFSRWAEAAPRNFPLPRRFPRHEAIKRRRADAREEDLTTRERTSAMVIIAALADKAGIDISHPTTAAQQIVALAEAMKLRISKSTVEKLLNRADDALDRLALRQDEEERKEGEKAEKEVENEEG